METVAVKIEKKVYKQLQLIKLNTDAKSVSKVIEALFSDKLIASEALFGFAGWLTIRDEEVIASAKHDASIWADLIGAFIIENELNSPRDGWENNLIHPSGECSHNKG